MTYTCKICNYNTPNHHNFDRHNKSNKHKKKEKLNKYCYDCDKDFETRHKYIKHSYYHKNYKNKKNDEIIEIDNTDVNQIKNIVKTSNNNIKNNIKENLNTTSKIISRKIDNLAKSNEESNKLINTKIDDLNKSNQEVVTVVNKAITRASSLIKYLMEHHTATPPLKKINYKDCVNTLKLNYKCTKDDYALQEILVREHRTHIFVKRISNTILNLIHHKNPEKQPIWNTDCSRNHYVVKTPSSWNEDKAGIKFTEYVIKPILNHIRELIHDYRINKLEKMSFKNFTELDRDEYYLRISSTLDLEGDLLNESLIPQFLKELSPHLRYLQDELDGIEKIIELEELQENLKEIIKKRTNMTDDISDDISDDNSEDISEIEDDDDYIKDYDKKYNKYKFEEEFDLQDDYNDTEEDEDNIYFPQKIFKQKLVY